MLDRITRGAPWSGPRSIALIGACVAPLALASMAPAAWGNGNADEIPPEAIILILVASIVVGIVIGLIIQAIICMFLVIPLKAVPEPMRRISTGQVWLLLIPIFNLFWNFKVYPAISDSLKEACESRGIANVGDAGRQLGMIYSILAVVAAVGGFIPIVSCFTAIGAIVGLVILIIYLVKIHGFKSQLLSAGGGISGTPGGTIGGNV